MASRMKNISNLFADSKSRAVIIFTGLILVVAIGIGLTGIHKTITPGGTAPASSTTAAPDIQSLPGLSAPSQTYAKAQQKANADQAAQAAKTGGSAIPTLIGQQQQATTQTPATSSLQSLNQANQAASVAAQSLAAQQQFAQAHGQVAQNQAAVQDVQLSDKAVQQVSQEYSKNMTRVAKELVTSWSSPKQQFEQAKQEKQGGASGEGEAEAGVSRGAVPGAGASAGGATQQFVQAGSAATAGGGVTPGSAASPPGAVQGKQAIVTAQPGQPLYKAGTVLYGVLDTAVNSDQPGPVLATIVSGSLKGSKLIGSITRQGKKVYISFKTISVKGADISYPVDAVAVDPNSARTALSDSVDNHYVERYGTLFASAFLEGLGEAAMNANTNVQVGPDGNITSIHQLNAGQQLIAAFGTVGQRWGSALGDTFQMPPTIQVYSGTSIGILLIKDLVPSKG